MGEAPAALLLVQTPDDVDRLEVANPEKLAYLTQTTLSLDEAARTIERLRQRFPKIIGPDSEDICYATQNRQEAVRTLSRQADIVLIVGSQNSSNSRRLAEIARSNGVASHLVDGPADIDLSWFGGGERVLIAAGASAPENVVQECIALLVARFDARIESRTLVEEKVRFLLPEPLRDREEMRR
jgi:4-hydroxy-3-methylbut-2-enyl diphosphate reductase